MILDNIKTISKILSKNKTDLSMKQNLKLKSLSDVYSNFIMTLNEDIIKAIFPK